LLASFGWIYSENSKQQEKYLGKKNLQFGQKRKKKKQQFKITTNSADKAIGKEINTIRKNQSILN
jgi:hypothetical protein